MVCGKTSINRILCGFCARLEKFSLTFAIRRLQSELIFAILNHSCFFMVYYYLFGVFRS